MYPLPEIPCSLPDINIPELDISKVTNSLVEQLQNLDQDCFVGDAIWRDSFAMTGSLRTFYTSESVCTAWKATDARVKAFGFSITPDTAKTTRLAANISWVDVGFSFQTKGPPETTCSGTASLVPDAQGNWKIWVLCTILEQLTGENNVDLLDPPEDSPLNGLSKGSNPTDCYDCIVVGGGQAGLSCGGRLQALSMSYVVLDENNEVGDSWNTRYDYVKSHLPFDRTFPDTYQRFLTKKDLAKGYQDWVAKFGINIWQQTTLRSGKWHEQESVWELNVERNGEAQKMFCAHVVLANGGAQIPASPSYKNQESFEGTILHSAEYKSGVPWVGKHGIVIGTANTGHDIAEDMLDAGLASVTMVQRSPTYVVPADHINTLLDPYYNSSVPTEIADRIYHNMPLAVTRLVYQTVLHAMASQESQPFDGLEAAGFKTDRYGDIVHNLYERSGGHYMDVGASRKIGAGLIKVKSDALPTEYTKDGLRCSDGDHLKSDIIVFATGFVYDMQKTVGKFFGEEIASQVDGFWGLDEEGELKGAFKPTGHPALWYIGGPCSHARYYSRFIALQLKALLTGEPLPIYWDKFPLEKRPNSINVA
ncbi:Flavin-containing monooxygenase [Penicillium coprophilum]|uniref:Flavin-containing monooxygenase n=1 Tax=Penicillium coprophilum TaxID=36646 RepID=UPI0023850B04|nr:Flavin-containing monooxygenase [Penicillium coprophilum]KAJ5154649.1 Flavin-containing monooxygenase [Penicillium coprophilum]